MQKIELIWREILETGVKNSVFQQKELAEKYGFSTSTVFAAIRPLRAIGAIRVTGRNFQLTDLEKTLMFWATHRNLSKDIVYQTRVEQPMLEIEGLVDNETVYGAYSAGRILLGGSVSDYDKVYVYSSNSLAERFPKQKGVPNLFVLKPDPFLKNFGKVTPVSQTYVDLWNLPDWYAAEFLKALKEKFYGFLQ